MAVVVFSNVQHLMLCQAGVLYIYGSNHLHIRRLIIQLALIVCRVRYVVHSNARIVTRLYVKFLLTLLLYALHLKLHT